MAQDPTTWEAETPRRPKEAASRASLALTAAGVGEFEWDIASDQWTVSERLADITGLPAGVIDTAQARLAMDRTHPDDLAAARRAMSECLRSPGRHEAALRLIRPDDGRLLWLQASAVAARDGRGQPVGVVGVVRDVSAEKGAADQREALVAELDHRVKNVLAAVQSLAAQSARRTVSLEAFLKTFFGRLEAMAAAHTLLTSTRWRGAAIGHIAAAELGGLAQGQAHWSGPDLVLNARATHALTLALHELAANAMRYGALSTDAGRVEVSWRRRPEGGFELTWTERHGPIVTPPTRQGFGWTLLARVTGKELGGEAQMDFRPEGLRVTLTADDRALPPVVAEGAQAADAGEPAEAAAGPAAGGVAEGDLHGVRVLIVEDAVLLALELESGLTECGAFVVGSASDLEEARRMLDLDFDVAVLDANLNGAPVTSLAASLRERRIPFIFATGYADVGGVPQGFDAPVVRKPYNIRQIAAALAKALRKA